LADAPIIAEFNLKLARETEDLALEPSRVLAGVKALLNDPAKGLYWLAEIDGVAAGQVMITYEWSDWRNGNLWWLQSVYVREEYRGRGIFRALFRHVREAAQKDSGVSSIRLYMHEDNSVARRCYEAQGMRQTKYVVFEANLADRQGTGAG